MADALERWFAARGFAPADFQHATWAAQGEGRSGLVNAPTGSGKTLAVAGGPLRDALTTMPTGPQLVWITPLKALAEDTRRALQAAAEGVGAMQAIAAPASLSASKPAPVRRRPPKFEPLRVGLRTGDASSADRARARRGADAWTVTTPESLSLLLTYAESAAALSSLRWLIVDEWHELLGAKRGVLLQLAIARLRAMNPRLQVWGVSATVGNPDEALAALCPDPADPLRAHPRAVRIVDDRPKPIELTTLLPATGERFPFAGHLGLKQLPRVLQTIFGAASTLLFTNTRAQAELWHQALSAVWPEDPGTLGLHHGSLDAAVRRAVEQGLRDGGLRCVVATSSLDLGVDFPAVAQVLQVGSPKSVARLVQRAGRSGHRPGETARVIAVPSHALEIVEYAALRRALRDGQLEPRPPPRLCLDVLAQHVVSCAVAASTDADALLAEVRGTHAYAGLPDAAWAAVLAYVETGGSALQHYPEHRRVERDADGRLVVTDRRQQQRHRFSIGTIVADGSVSVQWLKGGRLGSVEESFIARLAPGESFLFAGRALELVQLRDMTAYVRLAKGKPTAVPRWGGGTLPLSDTLGHLLQDALADAPRDKVTSLSAAAQAPSLRRTKSDEADAPELAASAGLRALQHKLSALPATGRLLAEVIATREGPRLFVYPFAGRHVHEGLAALVALRLGRVAPNTFGIAVNDYGFVLAPHTKRGFAALGLDAATLRAALRRENLREDLAASLNLSEMARRQFREVARIAGLLPPSLPGRAPRSLKSLQAGSGLLFDVLRQHDPGHVLLAQAEAEVFEAQLDAARLSQALADIAGAEIVLTTPPTLTPLAFPLWAEQQRGTLSTEEWKSRVQRAAELLEEVHGG
jgi:ATP-dependent Lhr-like helicase